MKMKKLFAMLVLALVAVASVDARGGHHGGGHRGGGRHWHGGGHRWHGGGWRRGGWWGGRGWGWGWGPSFVVPVGGSTTYVQPVAGTPSPCGQYQAATGASPVANPEAYRQWLFRNYSAADANYWWNTYLTYGC